MDQNNVNLNKDAGQNQTPPPVQIPPAASYGEPDPVPQRAKKGFAITALVLGIVSILGICCCLNLITVPLVLIFGIISLATKRGGTGMAITGIILAVLSIVITGSVVLSARDFYPYTETIVEDYTRLVQEQDTVFPAYEEDGTLPDYIQKYAEPPYSDLLQKYDITIYDVMDALLAQYQNGGLSANGMNGVHVDTEEPPSASSLPDNLILALPLIQPAF
ncbi:MAG TPA: hypothetical protein DDX71_03555 [Ruminococcus sp.]|nr:hypothetical protein [Ruminococcus sp.]